MERQDVYYVLFDQQAEFAEGAEEMVERDASGQVASMLKLKLPTVITGVRRCGKSSLLKLLRKRLGLGEKDCLYINFNDERLARFSMEDFQKILDFISENGYRKDAALFLDEVQEAQGWEKFVDRVRQRHAVILTGSNSKLLSREISTVLTGRSLSAALMPFSFPEFLRARGVGTEKWRLNLGVQASVRSAFKEFLETGGFPQRVLSGEPAVLRELYENIIYRDIVGRFGRSQSAAIKEISLFLVSNVARPASLRSLSKHAGVKNISTVKAVLDAFEGAFLFFYCNKFDYSLRTQAQNPRKVFCIDNGFVTSLGFRFSEDKGRLLENLAAVELKRRGKDFYYWKGRKECDFVVKDGLRVSQAIQVAFELNNGNRERELAGLAEAMKKFKLRQGLVLTYDQEREEKVEGGKAVVMPVWKWLLENKTQAT